MDTPDFPAAYMGVAKATAESYFELKGSANVLWTYVSPAGDYDANGARTGKYVLGGDNLILNSKNESYISYADLALAIIDELKNKKFIQKRFTAVGESVSLVLAGKFKLMPAKLRGLNMKFKGAYASWH
ncbi:Rrf2 family transcriptional regulator [Campylobacter concisus]